MKAITQEELDQWERDGFYILKNILSTEEVAQISSWYNDILNGKYDTSGLRTDLGGGSITENEKITQVMRPSLVVPEILNASSFNKIMNIAKALIGEDVAFDFDMLINKLPHSETETPWHQDAAYWPEMEDKRSGSFWIAIDDANRENGCMCYVPGSHNQEIQKHTQINKNGALTTVVDPSEKVEVGTINAGSAIVHNGFTLHYAFGNKSDHNRRAWIINFRPHKMIQYLRNQGYDHLGNRSLKNKKEPSEQ